MSTQKPNIVKEKSFAFALRIIKVAQFLQEADCNMKCDS